jgi:ABC-2 type transport system permease protein
MGPNLRNTLVVARREFLVKARTRAYRFGTLLLVLGAILVALAPVVIGWIDRQVITKVAVASAVELAFDPVARADMVLNAGSEPGHPAYEVRSVAPGEAHAAVERGDVSAALVVERPTATGDLAFTIVTKDPPGGRVPSLLQQAAASIAVSDRLGRLGVAPADQAALFAPASVTVEEPTPAAPGEQTQSSVAFYTKMALGQVLVIFLFIAIILYGQWVATSVAEEKASRVMEIVLTAATPFQLLGGKVLGVGGLGLLQFAAALATVIVTLLLQGPVTSLVFGAEAGSMELPSGLTPDVIVTFAIFFVLGFLLYAVLYAAAGSTVSRMEDVNSIVAPMSMLAGIGYIVAVYGATGLIPADAGWVTLLSFIPFFSPYMILSRYLTGNAGPLDIAVAVAILVVSILICLWFAARIYEAGVLAYGQKAGTRQLLRLAFGRGSSPRR